MNFKSILRMSAIAVGLGAILLAAPCVRAQQDMDPASFDDGPGMVSMAQPNQTETTSVPVTTTAVSYDSSEAAELNGQVSSIEAGFGNVAPILTWTLFSLVICFGLIYMHSPAVIKRDSRYLNFRRIS